MHFFLSFRRSVVKTLCKRQKSSFGGASMTETYDYGYWALVLFNTGVFVFFGLSYFRPKTKLDWRGLGAFFAFILALFTEMYGFPLTIYALSGWLVKHYPEVDLFAHSSGHLWQVLLGESGSRHASLFFYISTALAYGPLLVLIHSWRVLYKAQKEGKVADTGIYAYVRHPQYICFVSIMLGFLIQWPTLPTLVMFPILLYTYYRLAKREEKKSLEQFGGAYAVYSKKVGAFFPKVEWSAFFKRLKKEKSVS